MNLRLEQQNTYELRRSQYLERLDREVRPIIEERNRRINLAMNDAMEKYREVSQKLHRQIFYPT